MRPKTGRPSAQEEESPQPSINIQSAETAPAGTPNHAASAEMLWWRRTKLWLKYAALLPRSPERKSLSCPVKMFL